MKLSEKNFMLACHYCHAIDLNIIIYLCEVGEANLTDISVYIEKDFSNVHKRLKSLVSRKILKLNTTTKTYRLSAEWKTAMILDYLSKKTNALDGLII